MTGDGAEEVGNTISGGSFHAPVLQGKSFSNVTINLEQAAAVPVVLAQLPPLAAGFTGRDAELAQVAALLAPAAGADAVVVSAVAGLAGVGKTALAVHAAHAARSSGWFPGGLLFIDLHGYDPSPVQPGQALDTLLRALGVAGEHIPDGTEERAGLYRSTLAHISGPMLVIADNASAEAQVRPLMPGPGPHRVIITSRHTLAGLGARLLDVNVLDQAAALELLEKVVRAGRPDDDRIGGDPAAGGRLAGACGGLPLALQIIAALLSADPALSAAELAAEMTDEVRRLETLRYDDGSGVSAPSVAAAFELSYQQLDDDAARMFRLLPADPGPDVSTEAATELVGWPAGRARAAIGRLTRAHLVEPAGGRGRYRMHDLLRLYARQIPGVDSGEVEQATDRLLAWYLHYAQAADGHLQALAGTPLPAEFADRDNALAWLDAQRPNLIAAVTMAAETGRDQEAMALPLTLSAYLKWRRRFDDWLAVVTVSCDRARQLNDKGSEAKALYYLGFALGDVRRFEEAITTLQDAVAIYRETGDRPGEGGALTSLGTALQRVRRFEEAITTLQDAVAVHRETGFRLAEGSALTSLGDVLSKVRRFEEAIAALQDAVAIYRETGDRSRKGHALTALGFTLQEVRRFEEAITTLQEAVAIYRETGDRHSEGVALGNLGIALDAIGNALGDKRRFEEAIATLQDAVAIYRETADRHGEGIALGNLGDALLRVRRFEEAIATLQDAVAIYRETGDRHGEGDALTGLGFALRDVRRFEEAIAALQDAVAIYRETGDRHGEGSALQEIGNALGDVRRFEEAISALQDAVAIYRETADRHSEGSALSNLSTALWRVRRFEEAIAALPGCGRDLPGDRRPAWRGHRAGRPRQRAIEAAPV